MSEHLLDAMSEGLVDGAVVVCDGSGSGGGGKAGCARRCEDGKEANC